MIVFKLAYFYISVLQIIFRSNKRSNNDVGAIYVYIYFYIYEYIYIGQNEYCLVNGLPNFICCSKIYWNYLSFMREANLGSTVCPGSSDPFYITIYTI